VIVDNYFRKELSCCQILGPLNLIDLFPYWEQTVTEVLTRGRTGMGVHRINSSKNTIKRAGHSAAVDVVHMLGNF